MKLFVALSFLAFAIASNILLTKDQECDIYPECPGGCCYGGFDWECCPGPEPALNCAPTLDDCPVVTKKIQLTKIAAPKQCDDGFLCPGGCCPNVGWFCCPEWYCAPTPEECW